MHDPSHPAADVAELVEGYFEESLSPEEERRLEQLVAADPRAADQLARAALFRDRLRDVLRFDTGATRRLEPPPRWHAGRWATAAVAACLAVVAVITLWPDAPTAEAAGAALERIVAAAALPTDREYVVTVLDHGPDGPPPTVMSGGQGRKPGIDGARLIVRGADQFVLVRRFGDGSEFLTGSDGQVGWAVPPKGPVHLSRDVRRFRRGMPGEREDVPFLDLRTGLEELRRGYRISLASTGGVHSLRAERQRPRGRGPETVAIWYDDDGVATRIEMQGLATALGEPRAVALELVSRERHAAEFFGPGVHHAADRTLSWE